MNPRETSFSTPGRRLAAASVTCVLVVVAAITLHELVHLGVGRLLGLPTHFINLTAAGLSDADAAAAPAGARAWIEGSAPLFTIACGIGALVAADAVRLRRRGHTLAADLLGWIAVFAVPYAGLQLAFVAAPTGSGVDAAAVLVDYFGVSGALRIAIAVTGTLMWMTAGFLLPRAILPSEDRGPRLLDWTHFGAMTGWRRLVAGLFIAVSAALVVLGSLAMVRRPKTSNAVPFFVAVVAWSLALVFLTRWHSPGARFVRDRWIVPALIASVVLTTVGVVFPSDYSITAFALLPQLLVAAFAAQAAWHMPDEEVETRTRWRTPRRSR